MGHRLLNKGFGALTRDAASSRLAAKSLMSCCTWPIYVRAWKYSDDIQIFACSLRQTVLPAVSNLHLGCFRCLDFLLSKPFNTIFFPLRSLRSSRRSFDGGPLISPMPRDPIIMHSSEISLIILTEAAVLYQKSFYVCH